MGSPDKNVKYNPSYGGRLPTGNVALNAPWVTGGLFVQSLFPTVCLFAFLTKPMTHIVHADRQCGELDSKCSRYLKEGALQGEGALGGEGHRPS